MADRLDQTEYDVVIVGTGLQESLLALSLARSGLRIFHFDSNAYYGSGEAALSLVDAESWSDRHEKAPRGSIFFNAKLGSPTENQDNGGKLGRSRLYNISLAPQVVHCKSNLVSAILGANLETVLEFVAVGGWWLYSKRVQNEEGELIQVPASREDLLANTMIDMKAKRSLVKLLLFSASYDTNPDWESIKDLPLTTVLSDKFRIPVHLHGLILALVMSHEDGDNITCNVAFPRAARHLASLGLYGTGFAGLLFRWGGLSEVNQVACRACAVGGGTYALDFALKSVEEIEEDSSEFKYQLHFENGEKIKTRWLVGFSGNAVPNDVAELAPPIQADTASEPTALIAHGVYIVESALSALFPPSSDESPDPVGSVVYVPSGSVPVPDGISVELAQIPPVYLIVHGSESGECPKDQTVVYASMRHVSSKDDARILRTVIESVLPTMAKSVKTPERAEQPTEQGTAAPSDDDSRNEDDDKCDDNTCPQILWSLTYTRQSGSPALEVQPQPSSDYSLHTSSEQTIHIFPHFSNHIAFLEDSTLTSVELLWNRLMADCKPQGYKSAKFLHFEKPSVEK